MLETHHYWALFSSAFISSTLLPGGSEALLLYLASMAEGGQWPLLWLLATLGNTLGGVTSWGVGWLIARRFPARQLREEHQRGMQHLQRWGDKALLFSWLPVVGDPLCVAAGWLGILWWRALLFIFIGKALRYGLLLAALHAW